MRIVCTVTNDLSHDQRMDRICTSLQGAGHEVVLVGRLRKSSPPLTERPYRQHRIACRYDAGRAFYLEYNYRLVTQLRGWNYDAICAVDVDTLAAGAVLTRKRGLLIFDAHEWFHMTPEVVNRPLIRGFWKGLAKMLMPKTDLRYTVAPKLAEKLEDDYGYPFATVRNLPRAANAQVRADPKDANLNKIILYQGMLNPGRGLEVAIKAMDNLPECQLWIAGSGPEEENLRRLSQGLVTPSRVKFLGFVSPADLPKLTSQAWLGINLLVASSPSYYYSLANKALDYLQAGIPSVQMDFPEYRSIADQYDCYLLLDKLTAVSFAALVRTVIDDHDRYDQLLRNVAVGAKDLFWEREEVVLLKLWEDLARRPR